LLDRTDAPLFLAGVLWREALHKMISIARSDTLS